MRNLRKLTAAVLAVALVLTSMTAVFAADSATLANADKAVTLKDLGLYSGQDANNPKVGLENALTTQDSLIFLAKLFGYYDAATKLTADQVAESLAKFDDAASISEYAKNVIAYSASNTVLNGIIDGDKLFVGAKDTVTAARFATFMLKQMGYEVADYKASVAKLAETKGSKVAATITGDLTRDDAVGIMFGALTAEKASGKTVIVDIVGDNTDLKAKAEKLDLIGLGPDQTNDSKSASSRSSSSHHHSSSPNISISLPDSLTVAVGEVSQLITVNPSTASVQVASSNTELIATATAVQSGDGFLLQVTALSPGSCQLTLTASASGYTSASKTISVNIIPMAPTITEIIAENTGESVGFNDGDSITFNFDVITNMPPVATKSDIDALFDFGDKTLGEDYSGEWLTSQQLVITSVYATGATIAVGDTVTLKASGNLLTITQDISSLPSDSSAEITGTFGELPAPPIISSIVAAPSQNGTLGIDNGDTITFTFDVSTNQPAASNKGEIDTLFAFGDKLLGSDYVGVWLSSQDLKITIIDSSGATITTGDTITLKADGNMKTADGLSPASVSSGTIGGSFGEVTTS